MARNSTVTQEMVDSICEKMRSEGSVPTGRLVYDVLRTGSMTTIQQLIRSFENRNPLPAVVQKAIPPTVQNALREHIAVEISDARAPIQFELNAIRSDNAELIIESKKQQITIEDQLKAIEDLKAEKNSLLGQLNQTAADLTKSRSDAEMYRKAMEVAMRESSGCEHRLEKMPSLELEVQELRTMVDRERSGKVIAEQTAAVALANLEKTTAQAADLSMRMEKAEIEKQHSLIETTNLRELLMSSHSSLDSATKNNILATQAIREEREVSAVLRAELLERKNPGLDDKTFKSTKGKNIALADEHVAGKNS